MVYKSCGQLKVIDTLKMSLKQGSFKQTQASGKDKLKSKIKKKANKKKRRKYAIQITDHF